MAKRSDGIDTRKKLLEAASNVFVEKGFRETRVSDICSACGANIAAVNYHFGSKEKLYAEVWEYAWHEAQRVAPIDAGMESADSPEQKLGTLIRNLLYRILVHGNKSRFGRLLLQDMRDPVSTVEPVRRRTLKPVRELFIELIDGVAGKVLDDRVRRHCHMSIMHQCLAIGFRGGKKPPMLGGGKKFTQAEVDYLADHVARFSIGGIRAVAQEGGGDA